MPAVVGGVRLLGFFFEASVNATKSDYEILGMIRWAVVFGVISITACVYIGISIGIVGIDWNEYKI